MCSSSNPTAIDLYRSACKLAQDSLANASDADRDASFPYEHYYAAADAGMLGIGLPAEYGGAGLALSDQVDVVEALAHGCAAVIAAVIGNGYQAALTLLHGTSETARRETLPRILSGREQVAFAITEEDAGSDANAVRCLARQVSNGWRLSGEKVMINRASLCSSAIVFATVDPNLRQKGITAFLVDLKQDGVSFGPPLQKTGQRGIPTQAIRFSDAYVREGSRISEIGGGAQLMMSVLAHARLVVAANAVGRMNAAFKVALTHSQQREQFGKVLSALPAVREQIAEMAVLVEASRSLVRLAAEALDSHSEQGTMLASMAKLHATDSCIEVCRLAMLLCGGYGYTDKFPVERMLRDALAGQVVDGANPVQKQIIAGQILKNAFMDKR